MKKMMTAAQIATSLAVGLAAAPAFADPAGTTYVGGQFAYATYDEDGLEEANPIALVGRVGHYFSPYISVEGRLGFGMTDDPVDVGGVDVDVSVDTLFSAFAVGHVPITKDAQIYALLGFSTVEVSGEAFGYTVELDDSGFSWGLGAEYNITPRVGLNIEYVSYVRSDLWDVTAISGGVNFKF